MGSGFEFNPFKLIWRTKPIRIPVEIPLQQALAQLEADVRTFHVFKSGVVGYVSSHHILLSNYTAVRRRGMRPVLSLEVVQDVQGTQLVGYFRNAWTARIMLSFWFGGLILLSLAFLIHGPSPPANDLQHRLLGVLMPAVMLVLGLLVLKASQSGWDKDESVLAQFVARRVGTVTRRSEPAS